MTSREVGDDPRAGIESPERRDAELGQREVALRDMLNVSMDCIKLIDLDGNLVRINRAGSIALGVTEQPSPPPPWLSLLPEELREDGEAALAIALTGVSVRFPGYSLDGDGGFRHWDNMLNPMLDAEGRTTSILCVSRDVTALHEAIQRRHESEERLAIAARVGGLGIWDYDIRNDRLYCDESWYRIMGRDPRRPISSVAEFRAFIHPEDVDEATDVRKAIAGMDASNEDYSIVFRIIRPDGEIRWLRSLAYLQREDNGPPARAVGFVSDITESRHGQLALRDAYRALESERVTLARKLLEVRSPASPTGATSTTNWPSRASTRPNPANRCASAWSTWIGSSNSTTATATSRATPRCAASRARCNRSRGRRTSSRVSAARNSRSCCPAPPTRCPSSNASPRPSPRSPSRMRIRPPDTSP